MNQTQFYLIAMNFLMTVIGGLTEQLQSDLNAGKVHFQQQTFDVKKEISGGSIIEILNGDSKKINTVNSFDDAGLVKTGRAFVFDEVSLCYATNAASGLESSLEYNTKAPKELQNSLVVVKQKGREIIRLPFRDLHNIHNTYSTNSADTYTNLKAIRHFNDDENVTIQIEMPNGIVLDPGVKHYVYFRFGGLQTAKTA